MTSLKILTGLHGGEPAASVPEKSWSTLTNARSIACNRGFRQDCRALLFFINDASQNDWMGFGSLESYVRDGLTLNPKTVRWALDGLKLLDGDDAHELEPVALTALEQMEGVAGVKLPREGVSND